MLLDCCGRVTVFESRRQFNKKNCDSYWLGINCVSVNLTASLTHILLFGFRH